MYVAGPRSLDLRARDLLGYFENGAFDSVKEWGGWKLPGVILILDEETEVVSLRSKKCVDLLLAL